jgi:hypothetical protein
VFLSLPLIAFRLYTDWHRDDWSNQEEGGVTKGNNMGWMGGEELTQSCLFLSHVAPNLSKHFIVRTTVGNPKEGKS